MKTHKLYHLLLLIGLLFSLHGLAQDRVEFSVNLSKSKLGINERIRVDFSMNKDGDEFTPPEFKGFRVVMGPSQSTSSSWINGVRSFKRTFSYTIAPLQKGTFKIGQASVNIDGKLYKTQSKEVIVTDAVKKPSDQLTAYDIAEEKLHLVAEVSKSKPYLNEPITVVYKLYVGGNINVSNFRPLENPAYENFWSSEIPIKKYSFTNGTYKGEPYNVVDLKRVVLYPQKTGELTLEPLSLEITADVPTNRRDFFGGVIYSSTNKVVSAGKRTIEVKSLPEEGKPSNFSGAVGDFNFFVEPSKNILNAGESLQLKVSVKGMGNLKLFQIPELKVPAAIERYEPEFSEDIKTTFSGMQGAVSNSYTLVPGYKGKYPIPSIVFSYFNPKTNRYHSIESQEVLLQILEGPELEEAQEPNQVQKQLIVSDDQFKFIELQTELEPIEKKNFFGTINYYLSWLLPLLLIPLAILYGKNRQIRKRDVAGTRSRRANQLAKKYLSAAKKTIADKEEFYIALERALHHFLKAKLKIETFDLNKDKIAEILRKKGISESEITELLQLLEHCDMARYSPVSAGEIQTDYQQSIDTITQLDKKL